MTKGYVDNQIKLTGGLSISSITMQGDIDMNAHNVVGLSDPTNDDMAASKGYVDSNFLDLDFLEGPWLATWIWEGTRLRTC